MTLRFDADTLYNLLPEVYRVRDAALAQDENAGGPLRQFVEVLAEQAMVVEENIHQLYDDQFIETCAEWVVPYIGDLIGARLIEMPDDEDDLNFSQRAQVANTIATRRRKGTAAILEQVARDVTGFTARVVEFFKLVATTQHMNHVRLDHTVTPNMRAVLELEEVASPFTTIARTPEVRRIQPGLGKYNLPNIGIFLWRLSVYPLSNIPAFAVDDRRFMFNPLGIDSQLYNLPEPEALITTLAEPVHTPHAISRLRLLAHLTTYYSRAFTLFRDGEEIDVGGIQVCNLADAGGGAWAHAPEDNIGIDPVLGRIHFPVNAPAPEEVAVTFQQPFVLPMGGGEYPRDVVTPDGAAVAQVNNVAELTAGVEAMRLSTAPLAESGRGGIVEIVNSHAYGWNPGSQTFIGADRHLIVRAANAARPLVALEARWDIFGRRNSRLTLDGICFAHERIRIRGDIEEVVIRDCTLLPGIQLAQDGAPLQGTTPALIIDTRQPCRVLIENSIIGAMRLAEGSELTMRNSILDATADDGIAYAAPTATPAQRQPGGRMSIEASTVRGCIYTTEMALISNSILKADAPPAVPALSALRQQDGCVRFSYHPTNVQLPRRYHCVPADLNQTATDHPIFVSERYGEAGYFQLRPNTPPSIRTGADDGEEMGAYHDVYQHLRERNLIYRLDEYLRFGLQAGIFYVS